MSMASGTSSGACAWLRTTRRWRGSRVGDERDVHDPGPGCPVARPPRGRQCRAALTCSPLNQFKMPRASLFLWATATHSELPGPQSPTGHRASTAQDVAPCYRHSLQARLQRTGDVAGQPGEAVAAGDAAATGAAAREWKALGQGRDAVTNAMSPSRRTTPLPGSACPATRAVRASRTTSAPECAAAACPGPDEPKPRTASAADR